MNNKRKQSSFARIGLSVMACLALTLGGAHRGNAAEYYVTPEGGGLVDGSDWANAFSNVQEAVDAAASGDTVWVTNGVYFSPGPAANDTMIWFGDKGIKLRSVNGPEVTILDGNYPAVTNRVIGWYNASGALLDGFTVRNGYTHSGLAYSGYGAGIYSRGGAGITNCILSDNAGFGQGGGGYVRYHEYVADCVVSNNTGGSYGGLFCLDIGIVTNCSFIGNTATGNGGGVGLGNTTPLMVDCLVSNNVAGSGGGIYVNSSGITIRNCLVSDNRAETGVGGGIGAWASGTHIENCIFLRNSGASYGGGGVSLRYAGAYASNCWFEANQATSGGGAYLQGGAYLVDCILTNNTANGDGGGVVTSGSGAIIAGCHFVTNTAGSYGGGLYGGDVISNCRFESNVSTKRGGGLYAGSLVSDCWFVSNSVGAGIGGGACSAVSVERCHFIGNTANSGGGLFHYLSAAWKVTDSEFRDNRIVDKGGGLSMGSGALVSNCVFSGNVTADGSQCWGGGVYMQGGNGLLTHCFVTNNTAQHRGGGVYGADVNTVRNCLVALNAGGGGGIHNVSTIENSTVVANSDYGVYGFLMGFAVTNSIIHGNTLTDIVASADKTVVLNNCCYGTIGSSVTLVGSDNINDRAPGFVNADGGDFRLSKNSPCINAGMNLNWMEETLDLDGNPRIFEAVVDIGAYEFIRPPPGGTLIQVR